MGGSGVGVGVGWALDAGTICWRVRCYELRIPLVSEIVTQSNMHFVSDLRTLSRQHAAILHILASS